jgi:uncharacterized membrane protein (DUF485 family)
MPAHNPDETASHAWDDFAAKPAFHALLATKARFLWSASIFFIVYYFALLVLVGWFPDLMKKQVIGKINIAYLFALSQFFMSWIVAFVYVRKAAQWDKIAAEVLEKDER